MSHENFLFKTISISNELYSKIIVEIQNYYSFIEFRSDSNYARKYHKTTFSVIVKEIFHHCPNLLRYIFLTLKCGDIHEIKYIHRYSNETLLPHVDHVAEDLSLATDHYLALNFPVKNCEKCRVYFCEPIGKIQEERRYLGKNYRAKIGIHDNWRILGEYYLTEPTLINTNVYHNIENDTDDTRISLSIRFKKNPWHLV